MLERQQALRLAKAVMVLTQQASEAILAVYSGDEQVVATKLDQSPVTLADRQAHEILLAGLQALLPGTPVLSEEGDIPSFQCRREWQRYWLVDPLDGTKEFIRRNGEFTVNVALIDQGVPVFGVVTVPLTGTSYWGAQGVGAFKVVVDGAAFKAVPIQSRSVATGVSLIVSRRHGVDGVSKVVEHLSQHFSPVGYKTMGSSLKLCLIAEGEADIYPRMAPTSEWDTAAAQAVVEAAGGQVVDRNGQPLRYNTKDSVLNPQFFVMGDTHYDWSNIILLALAADCD